MTGTTSLTTPKAAAKEVKLRKDMLDAFGGIDPKFKEIDFHRDAFRDDNNIRQASIDLVAAVLHAIEMVMGFFVSPACELRSDRAERMRSMPTFFVVTLARQTSLESHICHGSIPRKD